MFPLVHILNEINKTYLLDLSVVSILRLNGDVSFCSFNQWVTVMTADRTSYRLNTGHDQPDQWQKDILLDSLKISKLSHLAKHIVEYIRISNF